MQTETQKPGGSTALVWLGRIVSALPLLLLCFSAWLKLSQSADFARQMDKLGYAPNVILALAVLELSCVVLYLIPWTSVTGAILMTGYMGGAIASHVRIGETPIIQVAVPIVAWLGLWLREQKLRTILPWRSVK